MSLESYLTTSSFSANAKDIVRDYYAASNLDTADFIRRLGGIQDTYNGMTDNKKLDWLAKNKTVKTILIGVATKSSSKKNSNSSNSTSSKTSNNETIEQLRKDFEDLKKLVQNLMEIQSQRLKTAAVIDVVKGADVLIDKNHQYSSAIQCIYTKDKDIAFDNLIRFLSESTYNIGQLLQSFGTQVSARLKLIVQCIDKCILSQRIINVIISKYNEFKFAVDFSADCQTDLHQIMIVNDEGALIFRLQLAKQRYTSFIKGGESITDGLVILISIIIHDLWHVLQYLQTDEYGDDTNQDFVQWSQQYIVNTSCSS